MSGKKSDLDKAYKKKKLNKKKRKTTRKEAAEAKIAEDAALKDTADKGDVDPALNARGTQMGIINGRM